jgi:hypothetical protein
MHPSISRSILVSAALIAQAAFAAEGSPPASAGTVHFATSCNPAAQATFDRAMAMLHSFWAKDAIVGFKEALRQDPDCVMAYWGIAMAHQQNPLTAQQPNSVAAQEALAGLDKARAAGAPTQRERDYIAAIGLIYRDAETVDFRARRAAYEKAMEVVAQKYPDDPEASIFYALALQMTAQLTDKTYANQLKSTAILEEILAKQPQHPGVAHYLIHGYDYPAIADRGVNAARLYAKIAPAHPHAQHMPSHIFTRLGIWQESIDANLRSAAAAKAEGNGQEQVHAMDYLVHAYLQLGEDTQAQRMVATSAAVSVNTAVFIGPFALAATPARYALERRDWAQAAALVPQPTKFSFPEANTHYARGLGFAHLGDFTAAQAESAELARLRDGLWERKETYWSNQVEAQRMAVDAWIAAGKGDRGEAVKMMRAAADLEDSMEKHIVTPGPVAPTRELLGDMYLQFKEPVLALAAYEACSKREPGRLRSTYGAAKAAELSGDRQKARLQYSKIAALKEANRARPELQEAIAYVGSR